MAYKSSLYGNVRRSWGDRRVRLFRSYHPPEKYPRYLTVIYAAYIITIIMYAQSTKVIEYIMIRSTRIPFFINEAIKTVSMIHSYYLGTYVFISLDCHQVVIIIKY